MKDKNNDDDGRADQRRPGPAGADPLGEDGDWLDREHQARVSRVANCDSAEVRKGAAEHEMGRLVEEQQYLLAERQALGGDEHVDAISRSGWFPYARAILLSARLAWILDAVLWTSLWLGVWALWMRAYNNG